MGLWKPFVTWCLENLVGFRCYYARDYLFLDDEHPISWFFNLWSVGFVVNEMEHWTVLGGRSCHRDQHLALDAATTQSSRLGLPWLSQLKYTCREEAKVGSGIIPNSLLLKSFFLAFFVRLCSVSFRPLPFSCFFVASSWLMPLSSCGPCSV